MPVVPAPYKDLGWPLLALLDAIARTGLDLQVVVTAAREQLPPALAAHPAVEARGTISTAATAELWRSAAAAFFPCTVEAFGYPLAEARIHGVPVLSPDGELAREIAGRALVPYRRGDRDDLAAALERCSEPVSPEPHVFDAGDYFQWLLGERSTGGGP
nr:glycosyltransferase [Glycomyces sp. L485]